MQICNYTHTYIYMIKMRSNKYSVCVCTYEDNLNIYITRWLSVLNQFLVNLLRVKAKETLPTHKRKKKNPLREAGYHLTQNTHERCAGAAFTVFSLPVLVRLLISVYSWAGDQGTRGVAAGQRAPREPRAQASRQTCAESCLRQSHCDQVSGCWGLRLKAAQRSASYVSSGPLRHLGEPSDTQDQMMLKNTDGPRSSKISLADKK